MHFILACIVMMGYIEKLVIFLMLFLSILNLPILSAVYVWTDICLYLPTVGILFIHLTSVRSVLLMFIPGEKILVICFV